MWESTAVCLRLPACTASPTPVTRPVSRGICSVPCGCGPAAGNAIRLRSAAVANPVPVAGGQGMGSGNGFMRCCSLGCGKPRAKRHPHRPPVCEDHRTRAFRGHGFSFVDLVLSWHGPLPRCQKACVLASGHGADHQVPVVACSRFRLETRVQRARGLQHVQRAPYTAPQVMPIFQQAWLQAPIRRAGR